MPDHFLLLHGSATRGLERGQSSSQFEGRFGRMQQFPLSLQPQSSLCQRHWLFVNITAKIFPEVHDVMFHPWGFLCPWLLLKYVSISPQMHSFL